ncbi:hypothetical protein MPTK1_5g13310 [Marchantia polymorpha subsp. ruderalis]|uniref:Uncharacterized protein n=2 Tax=Marchantia polymorpha TaxID=3197 RepID=A0AAF6BHX1_MARPO|nr:hypothetical protein MARPO_0032s0024 [Marchantia polymorpha]BBN11605.1 hypothetical protein Mp_5g13310 [Marchantia polymorpha subsp. ruderalis]|eukprot:PTQ41819.1 hypothetical protein MARPO_0032s0024 [Marchantia polymorpha]
MNDDCVPGSDQHLRPNVVYSWLPSMPWHAMPCPALRCLASPLQFPPSSSIRSVLLLCIVSCSSPPHRIASDRIYLPQSIVDPPSFRWREAYYTHSLARSQCWLYVCR